MLNYSRQGEGRFQEFFFFYFPLFISFTRHLPMFNFLYTYLYYYRAKGGEYMNLRKKFFDLITMENEYRNIHKLFTVVKETYVENGVYVEYY